VHSDDWRVRHAAARSVREYLTGFDEDKFNKQFSKKQDCLFRAGLFSCRMIMEDKINKVFDESYEILRLCHQSPILNKNVSIKTWVTHIKPLLPFLLAKCEQLNSREKSLSLKTLRFIFGIPFTRISPIIELIMKDVLPADADYENIIRKEKARILIGRLDILKEILDVTTKNKLFKGLRKQTKKLENESSFSFNMNTPKSGITKSRKRIKSNYSMMLRSISNKEMSKSSSERNLIYDRFFLPCLNHANAEVRSKASGLIHLLQE
jgi:hypothetical protein